MSSSFSFQDWLEVHDLKTFDIDAIVELDLHIVQTKIGPFCAPEISFCETVELSVEAIHGVCPRVGIDKSIIKNSFSIYRTNTCKKPVTIHGKDGSPARIEISFEGSAADALCLAHEIGHAVQLKLSGASFIPPIHREIAAFLSELFFSDYIQEHRPEWAASLAHASSMDDEIYLFSDMNFLTSGLSCHDTRYNYRMNYPLARLIAAYAYTKFDTLKLWELFLGRLPLSPILQEISGNKKTEQDMKNYLPKMPEHSKELPALDAYRSLGAMALLDIDFWEGESEIPLGEFYDAKLKYMQQKTALIKLDEERKPIGYATWEVGKNGADSVTITRQSAPFGDHLALQNALRARLDTAQIVTASHPRSAREVQTAWHK